MELIFVAAIVLVLIVLAILFIRRSQESESLTAQGDAEVLLGQPAEYPEEFIAALKALFSQRPNVKAAYLAQMYVKGSPDPAHPAIGIDVTNGFEEIQKEVGLEAQKNLREGQLVDLIPIASDTVSEYMTKHTEPFYKKSGTYE
jgi:hypothetical protein